MSTRWLGWMPTYIIWVRYSSLIHTRDSMRNFTTVLRITIHFIGGIAFVSLVEIRLYPTVIPPNNSARRLIRCFGP